MDLKYQIIYIYIFITQMPRKMPHKSTPPYSLDLL